MSAVPATAAPPVILTATASPAISSVVIPSPLPNFTAAAPGPTNGALTAAELGALSSDPQKAESQFDVLAKEAGFGAYLRLWTDANGPGRGANDIVITLYRIPNSQDADSFASGSQKPYQQPGAASSFPVPSIPDAHGYTVSISSPSQVTEQVVLFKSDPYVAIVQLASSVAASNPAPLNPSDAIGVSFQQYTAIRHALGAPAAGAPSGTASATAKPGSILPTVLAVIAGLVVLAVVAWIAAGPPRNRRHRRRAALLATSHEARVPVLIDVPVAETRPVRLARGPVIRVVEVDPRTGSVTTAPKPIPEKAQPRPMPLPRPSPVLGPAPAPMPVTRPAPARWAAGPDSEPAPPLEPEVVAGGADPWSGSRPANGVGPGAVPDFEPGPAHDTEPGPSFESEPGPEIEPTFEPGGDGSVGTWFEVEPGPRPGPGPGPEAGIGPSVDATAEAELERLALAESAAAELAARELAMLATSVDRPLLGDPEPAGRGSPAAPAARFDDLAPGTAAGWLPDPSGLPDALRYWDGIAWTSHVATRSGKR
jgi:hypothetical protein